MIFFKCIRFFSHFFVRKNNKTNKSKGVRKFLKQQNTADLSVIQSKRNELYSGEIKHEHNDCWRNIKISLLKCFCGHIQFCKNASISVVVASNFIDRQRKKKYTNLVCSPQDCKQIE